MNPGFELEPFQERGINNIADKLSTKNSVIAVSPGGSGKTVILSSISYRYTSKSNKKVLILVHKKELLDQTRKTLLDWYNIISQKIDAKTNHIDSNALVFVSMVETFDRRSIKPSFMNYFSDVGLLIFDEAHLSNFNKIIIHFSDCKRIGFTATPISAVKSEPLNKYYEDIVVIAKPSELIELNRIKPERGIVPCEAWCLGNVDRSKFKVKGQEFDEESVSDEFKKEQQIQNTINALIKKAYGKKIIIYNASIEHSIKMHQACLEHGFNSRHLDSKKTGKYGSDKYREDTINWMHKTPNAVLNNVGIATTGTDIKSVEVIVLNSSMMSLTLGIQKMVRGSRPYKYPDGTYKDRCILLDMGNNIPFDGGNMHDYNYDWDWEEIFRNPKKKIEGGVGMVKSCPECGGLNPVSARFCTCKIEDFLSDDSIECAYPFPVPKEVEDLVSKEMVRISSSIDVKKNIEFFQDRSEFYSYFQGFVQIAEMTRKEIQSDYLSSLELENISNIVYEKCSEWYKLKGRRRPPNFKYDIKFKIINELVKVGFFITPEEIEEFTRNHELSQ